MEDIKSTSILLIVDAMIAGGMERQIVELLGGMQSDREVVYHLGVLTEGGGRLAEAEHLAGAVVPLQRASSPNWAMVRRLPSLIWSVYHEAKKRNIQVIHTFGCFADLIGVLVGKLVGIPIINGSIRSARPKLNARDRLSRTCMRLSDQIVANSWAGLKSFGFQEDPGARVIRNGVDLRRFCDFEVISRDTGTFQICMVANFTKKKNQLALVNLIPRLAEIIERLSVLLVGKGPLMVDVCSRIELLKLTEMIRVIDDCDHPEPYIASSDVCLLLTNTSQHGEGISNAILEYMALGKPVIATDSGGNREVVDHGETGYLVWENDPDLIVDHIECLFRNPEQRNVMGAKGRIKVEEHFTLPVMLDSYRRLYREILSLPIGQ